MVYKLGGEFMKNYQESCEFVGIGHIDRVCDLIAQKILTKALIQDKDSRVAIEVSCSKDYLLIFGEITTNAKLDYKHLAKEVLLDCDYDEDYYSPEIIVNLNRQSENISNRVHGKELCWGDQSCTVGYANNTQPMGVPEAYRIARSITNIVQELKTFEPLCKCFTYDIKTLVEMSNENKSQVKKITLSIQTKKEIKDTEPYAKIILEAIEERLMYSLRGDYILNLDLYPRTNSLCDAGTTNRKIAVDMYGNKAKMDGGGFNGKDYTKGDMAGKILAEYIANSIINIHPDSNEELEVDVLINFNMGLPKPSSIMVEINKIPIEYTIEELEDICGFDFSLESVIKVFNLKEIDYYYAGYSNYGYHLI